MGSGPTWVQTVTTAACAASSALMRKTGSVFASFRTAREKYETTVCSQYLSEEYE